MKLQTTKIPSWLWIDREGRKTKYGIFKQFVYGNRVIANQKVREFKREYPSPMFLIKAKDGVVSIYKPN